MGRYRMGSRTDVWLGRLAKAVGLDVNYFIRVGFWTTLGTAFDVVFSFTLSLLLIRYLDPTALGKWYWLMALTGFLSLFTLPGALTALTRSLIKGRFGTFFSAARLIMHGGLLASVASFFVATFLYVRGADYFSVLVLSLYFPFSPFFLWGRYNYVKDDFAFSFSLFIAKSLLYYGGAAFLLLLHAPFLAIVIAYFYLQAVSDLACFFLILPRVRRDDQAKDPGFVGMSIRLTLLQLIPTAAKNLDKILLPLFLSLGDVAIYGVVLLIPAAVRGVSSRVLLSVFFKKFNLLSEPVRSIRRATLFLLVAFLVGGIAVALLLPFVFSLIVTDVYAGYIRYAQFILSLIAFGAVADFLCLYFESTGDLKNLFRFDIIGNAFQVLMIVPSILLMGVLGLVLLYVVSDAIKIVVAQVLLGRELRRAPRTGAPAAAPAA